VYLSSADFAGIRLGEQRPLNPDAAVGNAFAVRLGFTDQRRPRPPARNCLVAASDWAAAGSRPAGFLAYVQSVRRVLLRHPKLLFQFLDQPLESLLGNRVGGFRGHALGLIESPFKFFSVALFSHGDTLLHHIRRSGGLMVHFMASVSA
jgi:hypothetical protein